MHALQVLEPDNCVKAGHGRLVGLLRGHVIPCRSTPRQPPGRNPTLATAPEKPAPLQDSQTQHAVRAPAGRAGGEQVAGVQAHADARLVLHPVHDVPQLLKAVPDRVSLRAGGRPRMTTRTPPEHCRTSRGSCNLSQGASYACKTASRKLAVQSQRTTRPDAAAACGSRNPASDPCGPGEREPALPGNSCAQLAAPVPRVRSSALAPPCKAARLPGHILQDHADAARLSQRAVHALRDLGHADLRRAHAARRARVYVEAIDSERLRARAFPSPSQHS